MKTILVVDDMAILREPIASFLRKSGYAVICAGNGKEAADILKKQVPDLILLDIGMPVMDGLTFLEVMTANPETRGVPVILLTAMGEREHVTRAAQLGAQDYLLKSQFSLQDLLNRIYKRLNSPLISPPIAKSA